MFGKKPVSQHPDSRQTTQNTITIHAPSLSDADHAELREGLSAAGHHPARLDGVAHALALSLNAAPEALVPLLELEALPQRTRELVTAYGQDVWNKLDAEEPAFSLDARLFGDVADIEAWMLGLTLGLKIVPEKLQTLISPLLQELLGEDTLTMMVMVMSFAEADLIKGGFLASDSEEATVSREGREGFLKALDDQTPQNRATMLAQLLESLFDAYALVNALPDDFTANLQTLPDGFRLVPEDADLSRHPRPSSLYVQTPIRREGRKIRPNEPCPCGSGKKYKKCHGAPGADPLPEAVAETAPGALPEGV